MTTTLTNSARQNGKVYALAEEVSKRSGLDVTICAKLLAAGWTFTEHIEEPNRWTAPQLIEAPADKVTGFATLQFANGGLFDSMPVGEIHLVRSTKHGTPGPTMCGIDRFDRSMPGWSVGGGVTGGNLPKPTPCTGCLAAATAEYPGLPIHATTFRGVFPSHAGDAA